MKLRRIMIGLVVLIAFVLLLPVYGYATQNKGDVGLSVTFSASKDSMASTADYDVDISVGDKAGYFSYVGDWWGNVMSPGQAEIDWPRIGIVVDFKGAIPGDAGDLETDWNRQTYEFAYDYDYGEQFEITLKFNCNIGDEMEIWLRIYDAWGVFEQLNEKYVIGE